MAVEHHSLCRHFVYRVREGFLDLGGGEIGIFFLPFLVGWGV